MVMTLVTIAARLPFLSWNALSKSGTSLMVAAFSGMHPASKVHKIKDDWSGLQQDTSVSSWIAWL